MHLTGIMLIRMIP